METAFSSQPKLEALSLSLSKHDKSIISSVGWRLIFWGLLNFIFIFLFIIPFLSFWNCNVISYFNVQYGSLHDQMIFQMLMFHVQSIAMVCARDSLNVWMHETEISLFWGYNPPWAVVVSDNSPLGQINCKSVNKIVKLRLFEQYPGHWNEMWVYDTQIVFVIQELCLQ